MRRILTGLLLLGLIAGCPGEEPPPQVSRDVARDAKADGDWDWICHLVGAPRDCDLCEVTGWYDDGICDLFCDSPDSDCACGGPAGLTCEADLYCDFPDEANCRQADQMGTCRRRPGDCTYAASEPVCGCDGLTYPSACQANLNGIDVAARGGCSDGDCRSDETCVAGTLCSNFNINDPVVGTDGDSWGMCKPAWMLGTFQNLEVATVDGGRSVDSPIRVTGLASVAMNAIVDLTVDLGSAGAREEELTFEIFPGDTGYDTKFRTPAVDPAKVTREGNLLRIANLPVCAPGDDVVNGEWTLRLTNANDEAVRLTGWTLRVSSRWD